jgi:hypothetical protein
MSGCRDKYIRRGIRKFRGEIAGDVAMIATRETFSSLYRMGFWKRVVFGFKLVFLPVWDRWTTL